MKTLALLLAALRRFWQAFGPYVAIELLLPGGSLIALALFLYQRAAARPVRVSMPTWSKR